MGLLSLPSIYLWSLPLKKWNLYSLTFMLVKYWCMYVGFPLKTQHLIIKTVFKKKKSYTSINSLSLLVYMVFVRSHWILNSQFSTSSVIFIWILYYTIFLTFFDFFIFFLPYSLFCQNPMWKKVLKILTVLLISIGVLTTCMHLKMLVLVKQ